MNYKKCLIFFVCLLVLFLYALSIIKGTVYDITGNIGQCNVVSLKGSNISVDFNSSAIEEFNSISKRTKISVCGSDPHIAKKIETKIYSLYYKARGHSRTDELIVSEENYLYYHGLKYKIYGEELWEFLETLESRRN